MLLVLKILAGLSLIPFVLTGLASLRIRFCIPPTNYMGLPWNAVGLCKPDRSVEMASELIGRFKMYCTGLVSAVLMIIYGFGLPMFAPPDTFKNVDIHYYLTLSLGLAGGWLAYMPCIHHGNLVRWNILGIDPRKEKR